MYKLPAHHKRHLLQNQNFQSNASASAAKSGGHSYAPFSSALVLPLVPQLTGSGGFMKRFSLAGWAVSSPTASSLDVYGDTARSSDEYYTSGTAIKGKADTEKAPLQPHTTGGLWSKWWAASGGGNAVLNETWKSAKWYVDGMRTGRSATDPQLVKHLISLRVHLSTAKVVWIEGFLAVEKGMDVLNNLLTGLVSKGGKSKKFDDIEVAVLLEVLKCFRVLLNTEVISFFLNAFRHLTINKPGFNHVLSSPNIITHIAHSLHTSSTRLRALASELLAAICVLSSAGGHKAVLAAMSDYRVTYDESFRFESLIGSLLLPDVELGSDRGNEGESAPKNEEEGMWDARTASMVLVNALTNCPESLEERILLRDEFSRRGLNEAIVVRTVAFFRGPQKI